MKKILGTMILAGSLILTGNAHAYDITGHVKHWMAMKESGWTSADGYDDDRMMNALGFNAAMIGYYPWTHTFLIRRDYDTALFLADKKSKTVRRLNLKTASGYNSDLDVVYQGEDNGKGCYFSVIDTQAQLELINQKTTPQVLMVLPEQCIDKKQLAAIKARQSERERQLQQWVAQQSMKELCRRNGNC
ncbi:hypothetical protein [Dickeya poaceiphila]|uniref:Uncharacterized protein n=1 Tax=Dickeya poaceiphila TaxID=568768 RepID=A0A5B8HQY5_9GAMM|nr:hypothetical protein [Dickeya poaceiphila]QDX31029.1 hypothetical protein Dpoa569_0002989 [Dickeya poaceiphila]